MTGILRRSKRFWQLATLGVVASTILYLAWPERRAGVHLERARLYLREGRGTRALEELERSARLSTLNWEAQFLMGEALAQAGRGEEALAAWRELRGTPMAARAMEAAAEQARRNGQFDLAIRICEEARQDGLPAAHFLAIEARVLSNKGDTEGAEARYRAALEMAPDRIDVASEFASLLSRLGRLEQAERVVRAAHERHPESVALTVQLAELEKRQARSEAALALYEQAVDMQPQLTELRVALMELHLMLGHLDAAEAEARYVLEREPEEPLASYTLGRVAYERGNYTTAVDHLKSARTQLGRDPIVLHYLGMTQLKLGQPEAGIPMLEVAANLAPADDAIRLNLVRALWDAGEFDRAYEQATFIVKPPASEEMRAFLTMVRQSGRDSLGNVSIEALLERAQREQAAGRLDVARRAAMTAHRRDEYDPRPLVALGLLAMAQQDMRACLNYFEMARNRAPGSASAAINRARYLVALGQPALGAHVLRLALESDAPQAGALVAELAPLLVSQGEAAAAERAIREHLTPPYPAPVSVHLGRALVLQGKAAEALAAVSGMDSPDADEVRLRAYLQAGRQDDARALLQTLREARPAEEVDVLAAVLFPAQAGGPLPETSDAPLGLAASAVAGRVTQRERLAGLGGSAGGVAALIGFLRAGALEDAGAWQQRFWPGTTAVSPEAVAALDAAYVTGLLLQIHGWPELAWRYYEGLTEVTHPVLAEPIVLCGQTLGHARNALRRAELATEAGGSERMWHLRAALTHAAGRVDEAADVVAAGLDEFPKSASLWALAGVLDEERGLRQRAVARYRRSLDAGAGAEVQHALAVLLLDDEATLAEAHDLALAARNRNPISPEVNDTLGWIYFRKGQVNHALYYAQLAVLLKPGDSEYHYHLGRTLLAAGYLTAAQAQCATLAASGDFVRAAGDPLMDVCASARSG